MSETLTDKYKLSKRDTGDLNWGQGANANLDALDAHAQQATLRPPRTLTATFGGGAAGAELVANTTYFYKVTAKNEAGETTESLIPSVVEAQITQGAVAQPVILSWETVRGATHYRIFKSSVSGQEKFLAEVVGEATATYTDTGNTVVNLAISVPVSNTAAMTVSKLTAGAGVSLSPTHGRGTVQVVNAGVTGLRKLGEVAALIGDVKLEAGANVTLAQDGPNNKIVIASSGTAQPGYATTIVAAPTGVAATDRANIVTALSSLPAAGGSVVLREGTYFVDTVINLPANKAVQILGQGKATILRWAGIAAGNVFAEPAAAGALKNLTMAEMNFEGGTDGTLLALLPVLGQSCTGTRLIGIKTIAGRLLNIQPATGGIVKGVLVLECESDGAGTASGVRRLAQVSAAAGGTPEEVSFVGCYCSGVGLSGYLLLEGNHIEVTGCQFHATDTNPFLISQAGILDKSAIVGNIIRGGSRGISMAIAFRNGVISDNRIETSTDAIRFGEVVNSVVSGNASAQAIVLAANAASTGNLIEGNKAPVTDSSGATGNTIVSTYVTGFRKLGEAGALSGDVKLEAGTGIAIVQDAGANKLTISAAGYGTVTVAAPTGVAATDTANVQAALNSAAAAGSGGGMVILREGIYLINAPIDLKDKVTLRGHGSGAEFASAGAATTLKADVGLGNTPLFFMETGVAPRTPNRFGCAIVDLEINMNTAARGVLTSSDIILRGSRIRLENVLIHNTCSSGSPIIIQNQVASEVGRNVFRGCFFRDSGPDHGVFATLSGLISDCLFDEGLHTVFTSLLKGSDVIITRNRFRLRNNHGSATPFVGVEGGVVAGNFIEVEPLSGATSAVALQATGAGNKGVTFVGNFASSTAVGAITVDGAFTGTARLSSNVGFFSVSGGIQDVTGVRKLGEASPLVGDVKFEAGANITITQDGVANKLTIAAAGGSYATQVVAAPTGTAATDRANIQNAINALPAAGGLVLLREGTYSIDATIILPAAKPVALMGQGPGTIIKAVAPFPAFDTGIFTGPAAGNLDRVQLADMAVESPANGTIFPQLLRLAPTVAAQVFSNISLLRVHAKVEVKLVHMHTPTGTTVRNVEILSCSATGAGASLAAVQGPALEAGAYGDVDSVRIANCFSLGDINSGGGLNFNAGTNIQIIGNYFKTPSGAINATIQIGTKGVSRFFFQGNILVSSVRGIFGSGGAGVFVRESVFSDNHFDTTLAAMQFDGEISNSIISSNRSIAGNIILAANAASSGNLIEGNKATVTDSSGAANTVVTTYVTGVRKLGEAAPLTGDVKLDAGANVTLTQDAPGNKITVAATTPGWVTVNSQTLAVDGSFATITGLDLDSHSFYKLILKLGNPTIDIARLMNIFFNADIVETNYFTEKLTVSGATVVAANSNVNDLATVAANQGVILEAMISRDANGRVRVVAQASEGAGAALALTHRTIDWATIANVTQISIAENTGLTLKAGSRLMLQRPL